MMLNEIILKEEMICFDIIKILRTWRRILKKEVTTGLPLIFVKLLKLRLKYLNKFEHLPVLNKVISTAKAMKELFMVVFVPVLMFNEQLNV